jgi:hypothetical protein
MRKKEMKKKKQPQIPESIRPSIPSQSYKANAVGLLKASNPSRSKNSFKNRKANRRIEEAKETKKFSTKSKTNRKSSKVAITETKEYSR